MVVVIESVDWDGWFSRSETFIIAVDDVRWGRWMMPSEKQRWHTVSAEFFSDKAPYIQLYHHTVNIENYFDAFVGMKKLTLVHKPLQFHHCIITFSSFWCPFSSLREFIHSNPVVFLSSANLSSYCERQIRHIRDWAILSHNWAYYVLFLLYCFW